MRRKIAVLGGSGFVGRHLVPALVQAGHEVAVLTRQPANQIRWRTFVQVNVITVNPTDQRALAHTLKNFDTVINLIGIIAEKNSESFKSAHFQTVANLVRCTRELDIHRIIHVSALGADASRGPSRYLRSKGEADQYLHTYFGNKPGITVFRPSVIFGRGDGFVCRLIRLLPKILPKILPVLPLARARTRLAPVYIDDLTSMITDSLDNPVYFGQNIDVCGPHTCVLADLMRAIATACDRDAIILELPDWLGRIQSVVLERLPGQLMTSDQFDSLAVDSVSVGARRGATHLTSVLPGLVNEIRNSDPYSVYRRTARRM
ncbi:MAG: complex I NDUFA9 subunit family protein [Proteobacteria bacterium]|nr:complex I NDUFA9 subunit family protein [Pseudomonadota bacterium]